jgi:Ca2+-binding EF-hand superfamily protein
MLTELQARKLMKLFCMYDGDRDGYLVGRDFEAIAAKLGEVKNLGGRSPKLMGVKERLAQAWKSLVGKADTSGDKKISLDEWLAYYADVISDDAKYSREVQSLMNLIFDVFDTNGDGQISPKEWSELFQVYNIHPAYAPTAFKQLDANEDGSLSKAEILEFVDEFFCGDTADSPANAMFGPY